MKVELHIDELILEGVPNSQREQVVNAIEQALTELVTEHGLPTTWQQSAGLASLTQRVPPNSRPEVIGRQVAQGILGNMDVASQPVQGNGTTAVGVSTQNRSVR